MRMLLLMHASGRPGLAAVTGGKGVEPDVACRRPTPSSQLALGRQKPVHPVQGHCGMTEPVRVRGCARRHHVRQGAGRVCVQLDGRVPLPRGALRLHA